MCGAMGTTFPTHPHAKEQEADVLHQRVLPDLHLSLLLRGEGVIALLAQLHVHDARLGEAPRHVLQLQVKGERDRKRAREKEGKRERETEKG